ncbi:ABC-F family ATP-binding cassette domain-containing protein [Comamonas flocculans]|uniref:Probable ATP-binding protein YheS n=1 Tax=Comamonas flocculans TaxID=2597701 RepID=A0A5B8RYF4_9BURK|nr:ATP-binding cassette domain-containing protein [Comamonas flocculans]QEA14173.1 ATP-binding cassette domain-containing protein [Comamonas flocculans]
MLILSNLTLRRGTKVLLDGASTTIQAGERVALVGRNGAGKSSLFALLQGQLHEDGGELQLPAHWRSASVAQEMPETAQDATTFVLAGDERLEQLQARLAGAEQAGDGMAMAQLHADLHDAGAHDARARAQALILGLGFQVAQLEQPVNSFSGGWRMRLQLARALMSPSDLLLLDEPTNHLDLDALVWLEGWLRRYPGTLLMISHDREFLDAIAQVTLHIEHARLTRYSGNYSAFEEQRAQQLLLQQAAYERQQEKIAHLQHFIDRFKAKATKARQAQSRVKQIERMEKVAPVLAEADFSFTFREPANLPNPMLAIRDASFGYRGEDGRALPIVRGVTQTVLAGQRIGILGANGQGKSTLVKTIARTLAPLSGTLTEGKGLSIGYFAQQELDVLRPQDTPLEHLIGLAREMGAGGEQSREQDLRNYLGSFNFSGDMVGQSVGSMSGGEKARLVLALIVWQRPNLLLLDEPTNHLDLATREALAMALNDFDGTLMLVSHDRHLLRAVCDDFWLVADGAVQPFDGDLDAYQRYLLDDARRTREPARRAAQDGVAPSSSAGVDPREQRRLAAQARQQAAQKTRPLKQELATLEREMARLEAEKSTLEELLCSSPQAQDIAQAGKRLKVITDTLQASEERWLQLSETMEKLSAALVADAP